MAAVAEPFVGRADEIAVLDHVVAGLGRDAASALLVLGEPGIGKSRLLAELGRRAQEAGAAVLAGGAPELESDVPFGVFVDALDDVLRRSEPVLASLDDETRAQLGRLFPALADRGGAEPPPAQDDRYRAHRAVRELLERLAGARPLVLVLDDVHWADQASVDLLGALLRRPPVAAVLLALGARPRQLEPRAAGVLDRAARAGLLSRVELGPLSLEDARRVLGPGVDGARAHALHAEAGGNPFHLQQLARAGARGSPAAVAGGPGATTTLAGVEVPEAVRAALAQELAGLPGEARRVLEGAAVAGDPFELDLAAAAAGVQEGDARAALDALLAADLVRPTRVPRRFAFRHPLVRRAVYESAPEGWTVAAHERCAAALAAAGAPAPARAHHLEQAVRPGDGAAVAVLAEAGGAAAARAPASAARWFGAALRLLPAGAPPEQRLGLLVAQAGALAAAGRLAESRDALIAAIDLLPAEAATQRVGLVAACAHVELFLGRHRDADDRLASELEALPDAAGPEAASLMVELAHAALHRADYDAMQAWARRAVARAEPLGDDLVTAVALATLALAAACCGATSLALRTRDAAAALVDAMEDGELAGRLAAVAWLANTELYLDRYEDAATHAQRALAVGRATGQLFPGVVTTVGTGLTVRGWSAEGAEWLDGDVEMARLSDLDQAKAWSLANRALAAVGSGESALAVELAAEAADAGAALQPGFIAAWAAVAHAAALVEDGRPAAAVDGLARRASGDALTAVPAARRAMALEVLTDGLLALGRTDDAGRAAARAQALAASVALPMTSAWADRAAAALALDTGTPAAAAERALAAAAAADAAGAPVEAARSRVLAGRALAAAGDRERARAELERAAADFDRVGAPLRRAAAERELRRLGRRVARRSQAGDGAGVLAALSGRELEVARLVAAGRRNAEIAEELVVSLKTVETHVRHLFRKLGVSSRAEVGRIVGRADRG
jgi:DNA-binding NarL/FixJ family response regulator